MIIKAVFLLIWLVGISLITVAILLSIKIKKKRRISAAQVKRRQSFEDYIERLIRSENEKKSNYKIQRYLRIANYPFGLDVFRYRLVQMILPLGIGFLVFLLIQVKQLIRGYATPFPVAFFIFCVITASVLPYVAIRLIAHQRRSQLTIEIAKFSHRLVIGIQDGTPLYYAIKRAGRTSKVIKPYIDQMLIEWLDNPQEAIKNFGAALVVNEALPLVNTLLATWNAPKDRIIVLFQQQIRHIDTMRDYIIKRQIELTPLGITFVIVIPFFIATGLMVIPWYQQMIDMMREAF